MQEYTVESVATVQRLFGFGREAFVQINLGSDHVAWVNNESRGAYDSIVLLTSGVGSQLVGGDELARLVAGYPTASVTFRNPVTGEVL